ncbi:MAG: PDZ domain-containing protein, partial [Roseovarius sp.]|nr:PDZ domain-containing protein [Roseovarius sp.]
GVMIQDFTPDLADALGVKAGDGAVVTQVEPDSAAEEAGLEPGDLIVAVDGRPVAGSADLRSQIGLKRIGSKVKLQVKRDGKELTLKATLREGGLIAARTGERAFDRLSGAELRDLQPADPYYGTLSGVVVARLDPGSRAARSGLEAGDIILAVNRVPISSVADLRQQLAGVDGALALTVQRGSARLFLVMR